MLIDQERGEPARNHGPVQAPTSKKAQTSNTVVVVTSGLTGIGGVTGGGIRNVVERIAAFKLLGLDVVVIHSGREGTSDKVSAMGLAGEYVLPGLFDTHLVQWLWLARHWRHRKACRHFLQMLASLQPRAVMVHGTRPIGVYRAASRLAPVFFFRHDGFLACPVGNRVVEANGTKQQCRRKVGWGCLFHRCWRPRSIFHKFVRVVFCMWDLRSLKELDHVVTSSRYLAAIHGIPEADVQYPPLRRPSDMPHYNPSRPRMTRRVVFVGRLDWIKGTGELVPIMSHLPADYSLVVVGDGPARAALEREAEPIAGRIEFQGWRSSDAIFGELMQAEVAIVPSMWDEGFGIVGPEAFACGTPVVAYNSGGIAEWCIAPAGILVPHGDRKAAAKAIQDVCESRQGITWAERSRAGRELALKSFGYDRFMTAIMSMLDISDASLLGSSAVRPASPGRHAPCAPGLPDDDRKPPCVACVVANYARNERVRTTGGTR